MLRYLIPSAGAAVALALAGSAAAASDPNSETEPYLSAVALVQAPLLSGPHFRVVPEVQLHGYMARYLIDTDFGPLTADSTELLAVRVAEIPALEALDRASKSGAFAQALATRGRKTGSAIVNVITHPIDSVIGLPAGVARYFSTQWNLWTGRAQTAADRSSREFENKGDPYRAPAGPMTAGRAAPADEAMDASEDARGRDRKDHAWYARAGHEVQRETKRYLKYSQQRRDMAKLLGVDPDSGNPLLNDKLDELAWAAVWGNFSAGKALGEVAGTAAEVISWSGKLNQYVLEKTPEQLREINRNRLLKICSDDFAVRAFLRRGGFTDTLRTGLVQALEKISPREGCNELLELAATTRGEVEARYLLDALKLIVQHAPDASGGTLSVAGAAIAYRTPLGNLLLPLPLDYLTWNSEIDGWFAQADLSGTDKAVLISGEASMTAQRNLTARGWSLVLHAPYDGAPLYAQGDFLRQPAGESAAARQAANGFIDVDR